ncbi:MAG: zinc-binding dehydrogenase [Acidimicrobiales bacterium]
MRVARLAGRRRLEIADVDPPPLVPGSVLVAIDRCGIGGTDVEAWLVGHVPAPAWFGHEWVGRIVAIGPGIEGRFEGERVVGATAPPCGACPPCRAGHGGACTTAVAMIVGSDPLASPHGAFADMVRVDARRVHRAPEGIDDDEAALAEPVAVAVHAVARSGQLLGDVVAVVGAGTIGVLVAQVARAAGASRVVAIDPAPARQELVCSFGADAAFGPGPDVGRWLADHDDGLGADVVYECAGRPDAVTAAVGAARRGGTVVLVGGATTAGAISPADLVAAELTIRASLGYTIADVHRALALLADERIRVAGLCDRIVGFGGLRLALDELASDPVAPRKVLFAPRA